MARNNTLILLLCIVDGLLCSCGGKPTASQQTAADSANTTAYAEQHRPQFHFSPPQQWMNDPNGMVYFEGEYHFFYQHYPDSNVWGPMHWAHAVSPDMVHWENLPIALYPDSLGYIFSGSAVVDWNNTSGFGQDGKPPLVAIYTYHNMPAEKAGRQDFQTQAIAYSNDRGRTWVKYTGNPVLSNPEKDRDFRDPKVIWDEGSKQWVMALAVGEHAEFWGSQDLKKWAHLSDFGKEWGTHGGVWECPDLFPMTVDGSGEQKWVLIMNINPGGPNGGSATQYFVGDFDGKSFRLDPGFDPAVSNGKAVWLEYGRDNYAGVTWSDVPKSDGRRLLIGWMSNWDYATVVPTTAWRSAATLARSLTLVKTSAGYRLRSQPVRELESLRVKSHDLAATEISAPLDLTGTIGFPPTLSEMELTFELPDGASGTFGVELSNSKNERYRIGYNAASGQYFSDRTKAGDVSFSDKFATGAHLAPRPSKDKTVRLHLFFDAASAELFADNGETVMTEIFFPAEDFDRVKLFAEGGKARLINGRVHQLKSIWR